MDSNATANAAWLVRAIVLIAAEVAFIGLAAIALVNTWNASADAPPDLASVQVAALGGLALVLGGGFALVLGVDTSEVSNRSLRAVVTGATEKTVQTLLLAGVIVYMLVCIVIATTFALAEGKTPEVLQTISIAFAGYVVSYISSAYKQLTG